MHNDDENPIIPPCSCRRDLGRGCDFCEKEGETTATAAPGCYKLGSQDWLEGMPEMFPDDIFEVRFKNTRKSYFRNVNALPLQKGDIVAVEASPGHDIGIVSMTGDLVARQMRRVGFNPQNGEFKKIYRKAKPYDIEKWQEAIALEHTTMIRSRQISAELGLNMKIGDVEYQGDKIKAIFYYIADERVDFRELIKIFATEFHIRIEMKQIGARQEAGRIGGLGSCGRELCCASWMSSFVSVTTNSARHQEISLNPQKLAGQCGKLKCCLVYELDTYLDARKDFPRLREPLRALDGDYHLVKTDILSRTMFFSSDPHSMASLHALSVDRVKEIVRLNQQGTKVDRLEEVSAIRTVEEPTFANVVGEESLTRFDRQGGGSGRSSGRNRGGRNRGSNGGNGERNGERNDGGGQGNRENRGGRDNRRNAEGGEPRPERQRSEGGQRPEGQRDNRAGGGRNRGRGGRTGGGERSGNGERNNERGPGRGGTPPAAGSSGNTSE